MLAAYVATLRRGCEDEAEWRRLKQQLDTEPIEVRKARLDAQRAAATAGRPAAPTAAQGVDAASLNSWLASVTADDETYGTG